MWQSLIKIKGDSFLKNIENKSNPCIIFFWFWVLWFLFIGFEINWLTDKTKNYFAIGIGAWKNFEWLNRWNSKTGV